jgi:sugar/nucleoside kinase (ribokinase family)/kynurenine formamidase
MTGQPRHRVVSLGVHIVDTLGRPVTDIPPGQGRRLLDEIRITAAGTAAGTSVDLAKLGARVQAMGAIGQDLLGDFLISVMRAHGIDTSALARKPGVQTSATILPIRANGERPALHVPGATATLTMGDVDLGAIAQAEVLHIGGPDVLGQFTDDSLPEVLAFARTRGLITTMDVLSPCDAQTWRRLIKPIAHVQHFLPNDAQLRNLTGTDDLIAAARVVLAHGPQTVLVSCGADGCILVTADSVERIPAIPTQVRDTTGCGDACSAGYITGLLRGWPLTDAAWLAMAAASLVAGGLGSDAGITSLGQAAQLAISHAPAAVAARIDAGLAAETTEAGNDSGPGTPPGQARLPGFDELALGGEGEPSPWFLFGRSDSAGLISLQTPERVRAASRLVVTGEVFSLNAPADVIDPPFFGRGRLRHTVFAADDDSAFDDWLDAYYPQAASQWDSLAHVGYRKGTFYNGAGLDDVVTGHRNTIEHWARRGIAGRAVLLDVEAVLGGAGIGFDPGSSRAITVAELEAARMTAGVELQPGDMLLLHTGYLAWYLGLGVEAREQLAGPGQLRAVGLEHSAAMARYLWDAHVAAVAADNPALEVWPPDTRNSAWPFGFLHRALIGAFGMAVGELWALADLAAACRADGRYEMLITSAPLHVRGGIGSPANALAIR